MTENSHESVDNGGNLATLLSGLSKAFEGIPHELLIASDLMVLTLNN